MQEENKETMELMREPLIKAKRTESLTIVKPENKKPLKKVINHFYNPHIFFFKHKTTFNFCQWLKSFLGFQKIQTDERKIYFDGDCRPRNYYRNRVRNQKYNILTFVPMVLFNQFKYFFNLFFLVIGMSQFYEPLRVGFTFTYMAPLCFVISVTMIKEFFDDYERFQKDKEANSFVYRFFL